MWSSHSKFTCVLSFIFISSVSFADFCSNDLPCSAPLICSNSIQCECPKPSTCLSFIVPHQGGITNQKARNSCLKHSGQLLKIKNPQDFAQLKYQTIESEHSHVFKEFFNRGVWIDLTIEKIDSYDWCDMEYKDVDCVRLMKRSSNNGIASLCFDYADCNEKLSYICSPHQNFRGLAEVVNDHDERRIFKKRAVMAGDPQSQIQVIHVTPRATPPPSSSNTLLYIGIFFTVSIIIVIICCCFIGAFLYIRRNNQDLSMEE